MKLFFKINIFSIVLHCVLIQWTTAFANKRAAFETKNVAAKEQNNIGEENLLQHEQNARKMISFMNQSVDPCDDFYEYACGNWKNTLVERQTDRGRINLLEIEFELNDMLPMLIENPVESLKLKYSDEIEQAQIFYESCLQADLFPLPPSNEYLEVIKNITGFPAIEENWKPDQFDWFEATARLSIYGVESFVKEEIFPRYPFVPFFELPELGFDLIVHSDNIGSNTTHGYKLNEKTMRQYLTTFGVEEPKISEVISSVFELWHAILNVTDEFQESQLKCVKLGHAAKWQKWEKYFHIVWQGKYTTNRLSKCPCDYFYIKLDQICNERKEAVANYLAMRFLYSMDSPLKDNDGKKDFCNESVKKAFNFLIDQLYMAQRELQTEQKEVYEMAKQIRSVFREKLQNLPWLDENTRKEALLKESTITIRVGRVENIEVLDRFIREMKSIHMQKLSYEKNKLEIVKFQAYVMRYLGLNHNQSDAAIKPLEMHIGMQPQGFYYTMENSINLMAGILYPPAYDKSWPLPLKYGTLGYLIGHELTHGFDSVGARRDSKGAYRTWWTTKSHATFQELTKCYVDMFNQYEITEIHRKIDGDNTKDENIADHGGLSLAYKAYQHEIIENDPEAVPLSKTVYKVLDLKSEQLFYLGFAQLWCADFKEKNIWSLLRDEHPHYKYRVLGTLSNMKEFAEAYKCAVGSKMNPTNEKCQLW